MDLARCGKKNQDTIIGDKRLSSMKIAFDITDLYVAQAGVFFYRFNLIKALLELDWSKYDLFLLDYYPIHGGWLDRPEVDALETPHSPLLHVQGVRHRKIARLSIMKPPGLRQMAQLIDNVLMKSWGQWAKNVMNRELDTALAETDVLFASDMVQHAQQGLKTVVTIYDMTTFLFPEYHTEETLAIQKEKYQFAQEEADAVIAISKSAKEDIINHLGIEAERIHVVYAGVTHNFRPLPAEQVSATIAQWQLTPNEYILHVGTIEPRKNLVNLIRAYYEVWQKRPLSTPKLVLAGIKGWFYKDVFTVVEELGLKNNVYFTGRVAEADLPALYNGALFFIYPSLYEGFGMPPLEAMACGVPVITSNISSLPEVIGEAGILINPQDIADMITAIEQLIDNEPKRNELSSASLARAKLFSWEQTAQKTLAITSELLSH